MTGPAVVITGMGVISPLGLSAGEFAEGLFAGRTGIGKITVFDPELYPCQLAGQAPEFKINKHLPKTYRKAAKLMSRDIELAILAANEAFESAGLVTKATDPENMNFDPARAAIGIGAGLISCDLEEIAPAICHSLDENGKFDLKKWGQKGMEELTPIWLLKYLPNMPACHIGIIHDLQGPSNTITCGEVSGLIAVGEQAEVIQRNEAALSLAGGCEAKVNPIVMLRQCLLKRATFTHNDSPETALRPFDQDADGSVFGEGAGLFVLESQEHAKKRNAEILAEIKAFSQSNSLSTDLVHLEPDGKGISIAIQNCLGQANLDPAQIDLIIPCGTGILQDDLAEAQGITDALGPATANIPVLPIKSMVSHTGAASGSIDLAAAVTVLKRDAIPPARNFTAPAPGCKLNIVTEQISKAVDHVLVTGYTFAGQTAAMILSKAKT